MPENWEFYIGEFAEARASFLVDLALAETAPQAKRPYNVWVWIEMRIQRPDGFSHSDEAQTLWQIEDQVKAALIDRHNAAYAGRVTVDCQRALVFYVTSEQGIDDAVRAAMSPFPDYQFRWSGQADVEWAAYTQCLHPDEWEMNQIQTRHVLEALEKQGDLHHIPRDVDYFLYFPTSESRLAFLERAQQMGFRVLDQHLAEEPSASLPYGVHLGKRNPVDFPAILAIEEQLYVAARECGGDYDGWGTTVVKSEEPESRSLFQRLRARVLGA